MLTPVPVSANQVNLVSDLKKVQKGSFWLVSCSFPGLCNLLFRSIVLTGLTCWSGILIRMYGKQLLLLGPHCLDDHHYLTRAPDGFMKRKQASSQGSFSLVALPIGWFFVQGKYLICILGHTRVYLLDLSSLCFCLDMVVGNPFKSIPRSQNVRNGSLWANFKFQKSLWKSYIYSEWGHNMLTFNLWFSPPYQKLFSVSLFIYLLIKNGENA